jgi:hypothetical protein
MISSSLHLGSNPSGGIGHYSRENYVAIQFSLPQRGNNQMVAFIYFLNIRCEYPYYLGQKFKKNLFNLGLRGIS